MLAHDLQSRSPPSPPPPVCCCVRIWILDTTGAAERISAGHRADERDDPQPDGLRARGARRHPDRARSDGPRRALPRGRRCFQSATPEQRIDLGAVASFMASGTEPASIRRSQTCSPTRSVMARATSPSPQGDTIVSRLLSTMAVSRSRPSSARHLSAFRARRAGSGGPGPAAYTCSRDHEGSPGRRLGDLTAVADGTTFIWRLARPFSREAAARGSAGFAAAPGRAQTTCPRRFGQKELNLPSGVVGGGAFRAFFVGSARTLSDT